MKKCIFLILILIMSLSGCCASNQKLANKMIEKYSDDKNYITLCGVVTESNGNAIAIQCDQLATYIGYEDEICDYYIYSAQDLDLCIGDQVIFTTVPFHFYNGQKLPIVELTIDGDILISFDDGKQNLIHWVRTNFN